MRQQFITFEEAESAGCYDTFEVLDCMTPWASEVIEVDGGYHAFESMTDLAIWNNQNYFFIKEQ